MNKILQIINDLDNVGDRLASYITARVSGVEVIPLFKEMPEEFRGRRVLGGLGSFLSYYGDWPLDVWGAGIEPGYADRIARSYSGRREQWRFFAVRGRLTKTIFALDHAVPIGDPAILMPRLYAPQPAPFSEKRYFMHCDNDAVTLKDSEVEVLSTRMDPFRAIDLIVNSGFVFTEALHVAILAHAYHVPWAWILNKHLRGLVKWFDWFSSLRLVPGFFTPVQLEAAVAWYSANRSNFQSIDADRLLSAFPHDAVFE